MTLANENMKLCPSFPGYSATIDGRVISHRRRGQGRWSGSVSCIDQRHQYELAQNQGTKGYWWVSISLANGKSRPIGVHVLVADAFIGPCPEGMQVRHLDDIQDNNVPANLAYGDVLANAADRVANGGYTSGGGHHGAKLTDKQAADVRALRAAGEKVKALASKFDVSVSTIESIIYGHSYKTPGEVKP